MSYLARTLRSSKASLLPVRPLASFHTSSARRAMGESDRGAHTTKDSPDLSEKRESHKQDSVKKAKEGNGEWKPELASDGEQVVAGEKSDMSMKEMERMGEKKAEEKK